MKTKTFAVIGRYVIVVLCINICRRRGYHFGFWNQVETKKVIFGRKSRIICVKMFVSYMLYQHFYSLRFHAACGISTLVILKPLDILNRTFGQFPAVFVPIETRNNMILSSFSPEHQLSVVPTWNWKLEKKVATEQRRNTTTTYLYYAETHIANILFIFM